MICLKLDCISSKQKTKINMMFWPRMKSTTAHSRKHGGKVHADLVPPPCEQAHTEEPDFPG